MKIALSASLLAMTFVISAVTPAHAGEGGVNPTGARFNFAPHTWKADSSAPPPTIIDPPHMVRSGAVPTANALGLDPTMLAKPAPPPPVVAAVPAMTNITHSISVPKTSFNPAFGKPQSMAPQVAQALPVAAHPIAPSTAKPQPVAAKSHSQAVVGKLLTPVRHAAVRPATASPVAASYGSGFGYSPGPFLPSSGGLSSSSKVTATLLTQTKHKTSRH